MSNYVFPMALPGLGLRLSREAMTNVSINESVAGRELRSTWWSQARTRYKLAVDFMRTPSAYRELQQMLGFFTTHFGMLDSFLLTDPEDNAVTAHGFGVGNASTLPFQLQRTLEGSIYDKLGGPWLTSSKPRTNLCLYSQAPASWTTPFNCSVSGTVVAPDGTATAANVVEASDVGQYHALINSPTLANSTTYCASLWVKAASGSRNPELVCGAKDGTVYAVRFDISTGAATIVAGTPTAYGFMDGPNGWRRYWMTFPSGTGGSTASMSLALANGTSDTYNGDGSSSLSLWGGQCEAASAPSVYIATTTAAVTSTPSYWPAWGNGFEPVYDVSPPLIYIDGVLKTLTTHYSIGATGLVTFVSAPGSGAVLTWSGSYFKRVRFANPALSVERIVQYMWKAGGVDLISVIP